MYRAFTQKEWNPCSIRAAPGLSNTRAGGEGAEFLCPETQFKCLLFCWALLPLLLPFQSPMIPMSEIHTLTSVAEARQKGQWQPMFCMISYNASIPWALHWPEGDSFPPSKVVLHTPYTKRDGISLSSSIPEPRTRLCFLPFTLFTHSFTFNILTS